MNTREEMIQTAKDRGYFLFASSTDDNWHSLLGKEKPLVLQLYSDTGEFELAYMVGDVKITTELRKAFMSDKIFTSVEKEILNIVNKVI